MKTTILHDPIQLRAKGVKVLTEALGPVGMARFLGQFERGHGDYTRERFQWLKSKNLASILREVKKS